MRREPFFLQVLRQVGAQASKFGFYKLIECIIIMYHGMKQNAKRCAIDEHNVINRSLYLRGHVQTIFGKINVIVTLRVGPPPPPPLTSWI